MNSAEPRVLLAAYQCGPGMGSVSQIGWEWYSRMSKRIPTTLVTHVRNRESLHPVLSPNADVIFVDTEWLARPLYQFACRLFPRSQHAAILMSSLDFFVYDRVARKLLRNRARSGDWDLIHAVTPVSPSAPTTLHRLGVPLVLGPLNGGLANSRGPRSLLAADSSWVYPLRALGRWYDRFVGSMDGAAAILAANSHTVDAIGVRNRAKCIHMPENGVDTSLFTARGWPDPPSRENPLKIVCVARLLPAKGVDMLIDSVSMSADRIQVQLEIVGDGPLRQKLEKRVDRRRLSSMVSFAGACDLPTVAGKIARAHVLCLPSVRESGGVVLLEAMATARPVIAIAGGGPSGIVDESVGRLIQASDRDQIVAELACAFADIVQQPGRWRDKGLEAVRTSSDSSWDRKMDKGLEVYRNALQSFGSSVSSEGPMQHITAIGHP